MESCHTGKRGYEGLQENNKKNNNIGEIFSPYGISHETVFSKKISDYLYSDNNNNDNVAL